MKHTQLSNDFFAWNFIICTSNKASTKRDLTARPSLENEDLASSLWELSLLWQIRVEFGLCWSWRNDRSSANSALSALYFNGSTLNEISCSDNSSEQEDGRQCDGALLSLQCFFLASASLPVCSTRLVPTCKVAFPSILVKSQNWACGSNQF